MGTAQIVDLSTSLITGTQDITGAQIQSA